MPQPVTQVLARAEQDLASGRFEDALRGFAAVVRAAPAHPRARLRIADTLLNLDEKRRAIDVYRGLAWHFLRSGQPLLGLVAAKMVIALDPAYQDLLDILGELYAAESDRLGDGDLSPVTPLTAQTQVDGFPLEGRAALVDLAARLALDVSAAGAAPAQLPPIPLFSHLSGDALVSVLGSLRLRRYGDGEAIITEGEPGEAFFMLADGQVHVTKRVDGRPALLAELAEGAVFGEMALVSNAPRTATVRAMGEVALLSLSRSDLERHAGELESVTVALRKFTRARFLANLAATSPLFADVPREQRRALLRRFQAKAANPGDILIEEGEPGRGLFLVLRGDYQVTRRDFGPGHVVATLRSGDVFGEISLLRAVPATATVTARASGEVLFLGRDDFGQALAAHPTLLANLQEISTERIRANQASSAAAVGQATTDQHALLV
jgi:CRP-like cAMP-binding protein